jgi:hypothetical protein
MNPAAVPQKGEPGLSETIQLQQKKVNDELDFLTRMDIGTRNKQSSK